MPGRFPAYTVLKTNGTAGQAAAYYAILLDQDYEIISAGAFPDSASLAGQLSVLVGIFRGGSVVGSGSKAIVGPTTEALPAPFNVEHDFGPLVERLIGDPGAVNYLVPLYGTLNPKFYNRMIIGRAGTWLVIVVTDPADATNRAVTLEIMAIPFPGPSHSDVGTA
jgi:hypothetical protein